MITQKYIKVKKRRKLSIEIKVTLFAIPSYSPELNQIKYTFGILKQIYKQETLMKRHYSKL